MPPHRHLLTALLLLTCVSHFNVIAFAQEPTNPNQSPKIYWVERITPDGQLILQEYSVSSTQTLDFPDLEIWSERLGRRDPFSMYMGTIPDFKLRLLEQGYARLKDETSASREYVEAQKTAKAAGYGMWPEPKVNPQPSLIPQETPFPSPAPTAEATPVAESTPFLQILRDLPWRTILKIFVVILGLVGLPAIVKVLVQWRRRHLVYLIFVGLQSTGKTWLWNRISDPDITEEELGKIEKTDLMLKKKAPRKKPMGKYEIIPVYYDIAGGQAGKQVTTLLDGNRRFQKLRKFLVPRKSVWILMLATTQDKTVDFNSPSDKKVDPLFISEQLGHLYLPLGIATSEVTTKPEMVITCIGKFDIFADNNPNDAHAKEHLEEIFRPHINRIRDDCKRMRIPTEKVFCSARKAWGTDKVLRHLEKALYP
jgi:hypothetical protein